jgi:signal transduction histidine kinase
MQLSGERAPADTETPGVGIDALEAFADLLFTLDSDEPPTAFYGRLCEATCRLAGMDRAVIFLYDEALRRVRAVGSHGMDLEQFADVHATLDDAPIALRALSEDRVVEVTGDFTSHLPPASVGFLRGARLVCTPMSAAGRWPGVILSDRGDGRPVTDSERHLLWTLGKLSALAASARVATREQERARQLQDRIDLAREIHDGVIQRLFGVSMALSVQDELSREQRRRCAEEIREALGDLRTAVQRPLGRPSEQRPTTLLDEIRRLMAEHPELNVELDAEPDVDVPAHLEPLAQSVLAEALRNALKHADPTRVVVRVRCRDGAFVLEVVNDGVAIARRRTGMGLRLAAFEALQNGGVIEFGQCADDAWRVRLLVPVEDGG